MVPPSRHPAAFRRHRQVRQPRRHRAVHPIAEERVHAAAARRFPRARRVRPRDCALRYLVQRGETALPVRSTYARRDLLREVPCLPATPVRAASSLAAAIALRATSRARSREIWRRDRVDRPASQRAASSSRRDAATRRVKTPDVSRIPTYSVGAVCPRHRFRRESASTKRTATS